MSADQGSDLGDAPRCGMRGGRVLDGADDGMLGGGSCFDWI